MREKWSPMQKQEHKVLLWTEALPHTFLKSDGFLNHYIAVNLAFMSFYILREWHSTEFQNSMERSTQPSRYFYKRIIFF